MSESPDQPSPSESRTDISGPAPAGDSASADANRSGPSGEVDEFQTVLDEQSTTKLDSLLDEWERTSEQGEPVEVETLCQDHPELLEEVKRRVAALRSVDKKLAKRKKKRKKKKRHESPVHIDTTIAELDFVNAGALGEVYAGEDSELHRRVAIKFMHSRLAHDEDSRSRFALEAEVTGRLEHPGVVPLYGFGCTDDDRLFYAMRYIDGETLDDAIKRYFEHADHLGSDETEGDISVEFRGLLNCFVSVCKTIAYAHNRGIVHRDIKPANVMLGRFGETIVVDWGLAVPVMRDERFKSSGEKTLLPSSSSSSGSGTGRGAGTPAFMSPEQASRLEPTPASDIYSLGATLFKLVCGKPPINSKSLPEIRSNIIDGKLPNISDIRRDVPKPLEAICYKAMALRPMDRYATALDLAHDVERYLADEPVEAYEEPSTRKFARFMRRHRLAAQASLIGLCGCLLIAAIAAISLAAYASKEFQARVSAVESKIEAEKLRRENLASSAKHLSHSIANEIDLRWRILELEASAAGLRRHVMTFNETETSDEEKRNEHLEEVQDWLESRYIANNNAVPTVSWFVNAADGTQMARVPEADSIGRSYIHRDYFTGIGRDLTDEEIAADPPSPLAERKVHMCAVYQSTNTDTLMVAFSVPIWSDTVENRNRKRVGTLAMAVLVGRLALGDSAWLVDSREDQFAWRHNQTSPESPIPTRGLLLHHPRLGERSESDLPPRIGEDLVRASLELRRQRRRHSAWDTSNLMPTVMEIRDPLDGSIHLAAIEPVMIRGRSEKASDTGWIVMATEPNHEEEESER